MSIYRTPPETPILTTCSLSTMGTAQVLKRLHRGALFEVLHVRCNGQDFTVKTPRFAPDKEAGCFLTNGQRNESVCFRFTKNADGLENDWAWLGFALLTLEAERIRSSGTTWNHSVRALDVWDFDYEANKHRRWFGAKNDKQSSRFRPALVCPLHQGTPLSKLSRNELRAVFPRMLPSLWDALSRAPHGDLSLSNLLLNATEQRFVLLDPGVELRSPEHDDPSLLQHEEQFYFVTNSNAYPLLHPFRSISNAIGFAWGPVFPRLEKSEPWSTLITREGELQAKTHVRAADWFAIAVLYFQILTEQHPLYHSQYTAPAWWDGDRNTAPEAPRSVRSDPALTQWYERATQLLHQRAELTPAERNLSLALLRLEQLHRNDVVAAILPVLDARAGGLDGFSATSFQ